MDKYQMVNKIENAMKRLFNEELKHCGKQFKIELTFKGCIVSSMGRYIKTSSLSSLGDKNVELIYNELSSKYPQLF